MPVFKMVWLCFQLLSSSKTGKIKIPFFFDLCGVFLSASGDGSALVLSKSDSRSRTTFWKHYYYVLRMRSLTLAPSEVEKELDFAARVRYCWVVVMWAFLWVLLSSNYQNSKCGKTSGFNHLNQLPAGGVAVLGLLSSRFSALHESHQSFCQYSFCRLKTKSFPSALALQCFLNMGLSLVLRDLLSTCKFCWVVLVSSLLLVKGAVDTNRSV